MRVLYHLWLSPRSRLVRLALLEKKIEFEAQVEPIWERRDAFLALNPAGEVPVLVEPGGIALSDAGAICEYLEETQPEPRLLGGSAFERAEIRRLVGWFDRKFNDEVAEGLVREKMTKRLLSGGEPDSRIIRAAKSNLKHHLDYIGHLADHRRWLGGDVLSLADLAAAAQLSAVDYLGDVPWDEHPVAKDWYARLKSRPSFRPLLADVIPGAPPPKHYANLDF